MGHSHHYDQILFERHSVTDATLIICRQNLCRSIFLYVCFPRTSSRATNIQITFWKLSKQDTLFYCLTSDRNIQNILCVCVCARARNVCRVDRFLTLGKFMEHKFCATIIGTHETSVSEAITRKLVVCNKNRIQNKVYFCERTCTF